MSEPNPVIGIQPVGARVAGTDSTLYRTWRVLETIRSAALRTRCSLSVVFGAPIKRLLQQSTRLAIDERLDESNGRIVERASDAKLKEAIDADRGDVLSRVKSGVGRTSRTRTASDPTTWAPPSVKE